MRTANQLIGLTTIALLAASATAAPAAHVKARGNFDPFSLPPIPDFATDFGFPIPTATSAPIVASIESAVSSAIPASSTATPAKRQDFPFEFPQFFNPWEFVTGEGEGGAGASPVASAGSSVSSAALPDASVAPEKRQFFPFIPPFFIPPVELEPSAGSAAASSAPVPVASAAPEKRQFFPFFFPPQEFESGSEAASSASAPIPVPAASGTPEKRQFFPFPFADPFFAPQEAQLAASSSSAPVPVASAAPEKRQFLPFIPPFFIPPFEVGTEAGNAPSTASVAAVPVTTETL